MSALAFRTGSFVSAGNASGGDLTLNKPTGLASGDRWEINVYFEPDTCNISVSNGPWETATIANTGAFKLQSFSKIAGGSEPASVTISNDVAGNQWRTAVGCAYQNGTGSGTLIDVSATAQADGQTITQQTAPSVTTTDVNRMVVFCYGNFGGADVTSMTGFCTNLRGSLGGTVIADALQAAAGATGTSRPSNGPGTQDYAAMHIALIADIAGGATGPVGELIFARQSVNRAAVY